MLPVDHCAVPGQWSQIRRTPSVHPYVFRVCLSSQRDYLLSTTEGVSGERIPAPPTCSVLWAM